MATVEQSPAVPGLALIELTLTGEVKVNGEDGFIWSTAPDTLLGYRIAESRWYDAADERARAPVAVIEHNLARETGIEVETRSR